MPDLTPAQASVLARVRENMAAEPSTFGMRECGLDVADQLRISYPELSDSTLASLMGELTAYGHKFSKVNPDATPFELAAVFAFAAIELASIELTGETP